MLSFLAAKPLAPPRPQVNGWTMLPPLRCQAAVVGPVSAPSSQSGMQIWTVLQRDGPNHLGFLATPQINDPSTPNGGWSSRRRDRHSAAPPFSL